MVWDGKRRLPAHTAYLSSQCAARLPSAANSPCVSASTLHARLSPTMEDAGERILASCGSQTPRPFAVWPATRFASRGDDGAQSNEFEVRSGCCQLPLWSIIQSLLPADLPPDLGTLHSQLQAVGSASNASSTQTEVADVAIVTGRPKKGRTAACAGGGLASGFLNRSKVCRT